MLDGVVDCHGYCNVCAAHAADKPRGNRRPDRYWISAKHVTAGDIERSVRSERDTTGTSPKVHLMCMCIAVSPTMSAALSLPHVPSGSDPSYGGNVGPDAQARITVTTAANVRTMIRFDAAGWTGVRVFRMLLEIAFKKDCRMCSTALYSVLAFTLAQSTTDSLSHVA